MRGALSETVFKGATLGYYDMTGTLAAHLRGVIMFDGYNDIIGQC